MGSLILPRKGHDWGDINMDPVAKVYIGVCIIWTLLVLLGVGLLVAYRKYEAVRIRNNSLVISSILMIHVYLALALLVYPLNGTFPCNLEYWLMSIYFPLGIGLYQAHNILLLNLSCLQRQLMYNPLRRPVRRTGSPWSLTAMFQKWHAMDLVGRTYFGIGLGMTVQFVVSVAVFLASRKFHSFGITSTAGNATQCRKGWEWVPSIFWQFAWTYAFGPYVLFKIRKIQDVHHWTLQTNLTVIFSLPGAPLWLAAIYGPGLQNVNVYWPAQMWFVPGLVMMEFVSIFFPLLEIWESRRSRGLSLVELSKWEKAAYIDSLKSGLVGRNSSIDYEAPLSKADMYNMQALERTLATNATPLLQFAATKEFTGENIIFLTQVRDWKRIWRQTRLDFGFISPETRSRLYKHAAEIFQSTVCLQTAQFPVNIESRIYQSLEHLFRSERAAVEKEHVTPFADDVVPVDWCSSSPSIKARSSGGFPSSLDEAAASTPMEVLSQVPEAFDESVFDRAEASVKYMVFTNTWARFVSDWSSSWRLSTEGSDSTKSTQSICSKA
ncbi:MAG: hypothetical protein M1825_000097 [Sarcosagium campestre]|nr:MAG: hypothetical protein M1825_000097 [Sarcosagium campestre]